MSIRQLPPLRLLTVFEAVLKAGNLQKAAADLNVTQPAVSQALKSLEDHVGVRLLDRRTRPAALTEAGRILQMATADGLGRIADAIDQVRAMRPVDEGSVTVACSVGVATYWLMPKLAGFYHEHSDIAVNVMTTSQGAPRLDTGIDLAIRYGLGDWTDGEVVKLFDERVLPVCHPALRKRLTDNAVGLERAPLLHVNAGEDTWLSWKHYLHSSGLPEARLPGRIFTNYVQATQAALDGQGVMLGWESITADLVREGRLVAVNDIAYHPKEAFYLVVSRRSDGKAARDLLAAWFRKAASGEVPD